MIGACAGGKGRDSSATPPPNQLLVGAASRQGVGGGSVEVTRADAVVWTDVGLGCREAGVAYAQVLTPSCWIVVRPGGQELDYDTSRSGALRMCRVPAGERQLPAAGE